MANGPIIPKVNRPAGGKRPLVAYMDPSLTRELIQGLGLTFRWSRAIACPCLANEDTDQPDPTCTLCGGDGWWYVNPDQKIERHAVSRDYLDVKAAFSSGHVNPKLYEEFGRYEYGEAELTVQSEMRVGFRDRFVGLEQELAWTEVVTRTTTRADVPIGRTGRSTTVQKQAMRYEPVRVDFVGRADGTVYFEGLDWTLSHETLCTPAFPGEPRKLLWVDGRGPTNGERFTVHYVCRPVWVVDAATYAVQFIHGPATGIKGTPVKQEHPTTFRVKLDFLTGARGT